MSTIMAWPNGISSNTTRKAPILFPIYSFFVIFYLISYDFFPGCKDTHYFLPVKYPKMTISTSDQVLRQAKRLGRVDKRDVDFRFQGCDASRLSPAIVKR